MAGQDMTDDRELRIAARAVRLYAETHPRPTQVTQKQASRRICQVRDRSVQAMLAETGLLKP